MHNFVEKVNDITVEILITENPNSKAALLLFTA